MSEDKTIETDVKQEQADTKVENNVPISRLNEVITKGMNFVNLLNLLNQKRKTVGVQNFKKKKNGKNSIQSLLKNLNLINLLRQNGNQWMQNFEKSLYLNYLNLSEKNFPMLIQRFFWI